MLRVGLDLSTTSSAVVLINEKGYMVDFFLIQPNKALDILDRIIVIGQEIRDILGYYKLDIQATNIESGALYGKGKRNELAMLNGLVYFISRDLGLETHTTPPTTVKKKATGNGRASKDDMFQALPKIIQSRFEKSEYKKLDDLTDAYHLASIIPV
jgi:Holliday junction resolvasome RuvABC endonuclease subunit